MRQHESEMPWWMRTTRSGKMPLLVWLRIWWYGRKQDDDVDDGYLW